jgi:hypothetical protein
MTQKLSEKTRPERIVLPEGGGDKYTIRVIQAGAGSSGFYPIDMLERDAPAAFPKGTRMKANHDGLCEDGGDIRRVIAKTITDPWREGDSVYTDIRVAEGYNDFFREFADTIGVSISAAGEYQTREATPAEVESGVAEEGDQVTARDEETGKPIIAKLYSQEESPYNSIDFVEAPGAGGRIVAALESARTAMKELNVREQARFASPLLDEKDSSADPSRKIKKENTLDEAERNALVESIKSAVIAGVVEAVKPAEVPTVETKGEDVAEAAFKAGLSEGGRKAVYSRVAGGEAVEAAVAAEQAREKEIEERYEARLKQTTVEDAGYTSSFDSSKVVLEAAEPATVIEMSAADYDALLGV